MMKFRLPVLLVFLNIWKFSSSSCPLGYDVFNNHCFYLSKERMTYPEAKQLCESHDGIEVWFSDEEKANLIVDYLIANFRRLSIEAAVWLSAVDNTFKWQSSGTDAKYMMDKYFKWYVFDAKNVQTFAIVINGKVDICRNQNICRTYQALCETEGKQTKPKSSDDYEYTEYEGDEYDYDYEDGKPDEDVTFDANNILTKGP